MGKCTLFWKTPSVSSFNCNSNTHFDCSLTRFNHSRTIHPGAEEWSWQTSHDINTKLPVRVASWRMQVGLFIIFSPRSNNRIFQPHPLRPYAVEDCLRYGPDWKCCCSSFLTCCPTCWSVWLIINSLYHTTLAMQAVHAPGISHCLLQPCSCTTGCHTSIN